jgi:Fe-S-cluster containining protein
MRADASSHAREKNQPKRSKSKHAPARARSATPPPAARNAKERRKATRPAPVKVERRRLPILASQPAHVPCLSCGLCCSYVAVDIDDPSTLRGATTILWYLYHEGISVYTDGEDWMIAFDTRCRHLQDDNRCRIYESRPQICREFDETNCEVNADDLGTTFATVPEFLTYLEQNHRRIYNLLCKRYRPDDGLLLAPPAMRSKLGAYAPRLHAVRKLRPRVD